MSMSDSVNKLLRLIRQIGAAVRRHDSRLTDLEKSVGQYQASRDSFAVPPGSTLFSSADVRFFRITADAGTTATGKLQTINASGAMIDDTDDTADYTIYKADTSVTLTVDAKLPASFEGVATGSGSTARYYLLSAPSAAGLFPVKVQQTGGSNGTNTTAASYTYTVRSIAWNGTTGGSTLGTGVAVSKPREAGQVTFQTGSTGYGIAFMDGSTLVLWDAGEKYTIVTGCS